MCWDPAAHCTNNEPAPAPAERQQTGVQGTLKKSLESCRTRAQQFPASSYKDKWGRARFAMPEVWECQRSKHTRADAPTSADQPFKLCSTIPHCRCTRNWLNHTRGAAGNWTQWPETGQAGVGTAGTALLLGGAGAHSTMPPNPASQHSPTALLTILP